MGSVMDPYQCLRHFKKYIGSVLISSMVYVDSIWDPSWIRTNGYGILKNIESVLISSTVYVGSVWDPSWIRTTIL